MDGFLAQTKATLRDIDTLHEYIKDIDYLNTQKNNTVMDKEKEKQTDIRINVLNKKFTELTDKIKERLEELTVLTIDLEEKSKNKKVSDINKIHLHSLRTKLTNAINEYNKMQNKHREESIGVFKRQYTIAKPDATENEINEVINDESNKKIEAAFALGARSTRGILQEAENRKNNISNIGRTIKELTETIDILKSQVERQTPFVDSIKINLETGRENVEAANVDLEEALNYQIRATKIKRVIMVILLILIVIGGIWFYNKFIHTGGNSG